MSAELWDIVHDMFDTDDGSLPDIYILNLTSQGVVGMWEYLCEKAPGFAGEPSFWDRAKQESVSIESVVNAAELVVNGEAESFHAVLQGVSLRDAVIPDLGVFVFPDALYLDYRMGPQWNKAELAALFELLHQLRKLDTRALVTLPPECLDDHKKRFAEAFEMYRETAA
jgi:hypothetical protein